MADTLKMPGARTGAPGAAAALETPTARFGRSSSALELAGHSPAITRVQELVRRAASLDVGVLLTAERGADVDSVARELHGRSRRSQGVAGLHLGVVPGATEGGIVIGL